LSLLRFGGHLLKEKMSTMPRKKPKQFSPEFRVKAIRQVNIGDRTLSKVARDLGVSMQTLWQLGSPVGGGRGKGVSLEELATTERQELVQLRREVARLPEAREILKKTTAFFAKENK
jgi:transposase